MDTINSCRCCLLRPPDKDMKTPYTRFGITEIYLDMIKECFEIQLYVDNESGICEVCVGRLQDASDFKLQVQRSQKELRARQEFEVQFKDEPSVKREIENDMGNEDIQDFSDESAIQSKTLEASPVDSRYIIITFNQEANDSCKQELTPTPGVSENVLTVGSSPSVEYPCDVKAPTKCLMRHETCDRETGLSQMPAYAEDTNSMQEMHDNKLQQNGTFMWDIYGHQFSIKSETTRQFKNPMAKQTVSSKKYPNEFYSKDKLSQCNKAHTGRLYICDICKHQTTSKIGLISHMRLHGNLKPYSCQICNKIFKNKVALSQHKRYHKIFKCEVCNVHTKSKSELRAHKHIHINERSFVCEKCGERFPHKRYLYMHKVVHIEEKPHICELCDRKFKTKSALRSHEKNIHTVDKPYQCDSCDQRYAQLGALNRHKQKHGEKRYCCDICGKKLNSKTYLNAHIRYHMGEKLFTCDICQKKFYNKVHLSMHIVAHMGLQPYSCQVCDKKFTYARGLARHQLIHTGEKPYPCDICHKQFRYKDKLRDHRRIHTGEKPYCCEVCGKEFSSKTNFKTHSQIHVKGNTFTCELCPKHYSTKEGLRQHKRVHTGKKACPKKAKSNKVN